MTFIHEAQAAAFKLAPSGSQPSVSSSGSLTGEVTSLATRIIDIALILAAILAVLYIMYAGFQYITSAGNAERTKSARNGIINAVIGIVIIIAAFMIVRFAATLGNTLTDESPATPTPSSQPRTPRPTATPTATPVPSPASDPFNSEDVFI